MALFYDASIDTPSEEQKTPASAVMLAPEASSLIAKAVCKGIWYYTLTSIPVFLVLWFLVYALNHV
jgi:hypothetical protein